MNVKRIILLTILIFSLGICFTGCVFNFDPNDIPSYDTNINNNSFESYMNNKNWVNIEASTTKINNIDYYYIDSYSTLQNINVLKHTVKFYKKETNNAIGNEVYYATVFYEYNSTYHFNNTFKLELVPYLTESRLPPNLVSQFNDFFTNPKIKNFIFIKENRIMKVGTKSYY